MQIITSIYNFESHFVFPFLSKNNDKTIEKVNISINNLSKEETYTIDIPIKYIPNENTIPDCTFEKLQQFCDESFKKQIKQFIQDVYYKTNIYEDSLIKCVFEYIFKSQDKIEKLSLYKYAVISSIDISKINNDSACSFSIEREKAHVKILVNNKNYESYSCKIIASTTYSDIDISEDIYIQENMIDKYISIHNMELKYIYIIIIGKEFDGEKKIQKFIYNASTILIPTIQTMPQTQKTEDNTTMYKFYINVKCNVFNGIKYVDYSSYFIKYGFVLQSNNDVKFRLNKNITK